MRTAVLIFALCAIGCTHAIEVKNRNQYSLHATAPRSLTFSMQLPVGDETARPLGDATKDGLAAQSSVSRVTMVQESPPDFTPDYVVSLQARTEFTGSGWNYLVSFPGFLIFTHAWNGYAYGGARTTTEIQLHRPGVAEAVGARTVETDWDFRHCDFGRGAWTSSGWYTPGYGGLNLVIGFFMIQYDTDATEPLMAAVHRPYGEYIANNIVELASSAEPKAAPPAPMPSDSAPSDSPPPAPAPSAAAPAPPPPAPPSPPPQ